jgi:hypothetical protein
VEYACAVSLPFLLPSRLLVACIQYGTSHECLLILLSVKDLHSFQTFIFVYSTLSDTSVAYVDAISLILLIYLFYGTFPTA